MSAQLSSFVALLRRYPLSASCVILTLVLGVTAWFLHGQIGDLEVVHRERTKEGEAMLALLVGGSTQRQELAAVREAARRIEDNLVIESNLAENAWYFYRIEEQSKVRLSELHPLNSPTSDNSPFFKRIPYTLRVTGDYEKTAAFLLALESGPRLINIINFNFSRGASGLTLDMSIELLGKK